MYGVNYIKECCQELNGYNYDNYSEHETAYCIKSWMYCSLKVHANGEKPVKLIHERRPSEPLEIQEYRQKIYVPITKSTIQKVINSLSKIRRSPDWNIKFPSDIDAKIKEGEDLQTFIFEKYPYGFVSITNWLFSIFLKNFLIDANAVILVMPFNFYKDQGEYYKPVPIIFNSPDVIKFHDGHYAMLRSGKKCRYEQRDGVGNIMAQYDDGDIIIEVTQDQINTYHQIDREGNFELVEELPYNIGIFPAFKMPGIYFQTCGEDVIHESRISGMVPHLDEAVRLFSDLQAEVVQHVHSQKWEIQNQECKTCRGRGELMIGNATCECNKCNGVGTVPTSPYLNIVYNVPEVGQQQVPTPPAGYIQKTDVALMLDKMDKLVASQIISALSSISMQFLDQTPLNNSGLSKEVDRDESNNFVHACAEDMVYCGDKIILISAHWRYYELLNGDLKKLYSMLPMFTVPEKFDLFSSTYLLEEVTKVKSNNLNNYIISTLETEYAAKKFYNMPEVAKELTLIYSLDPMPALTDEQKIIRLQNDGVTQVDYVISSNIVPFVKRALREVKNYYLLDFNQQYSYLTHYATEKMNTNSALNTVTREEITVIE